MRGRSIAAEMFKPHSKLRMTWTTEGKMREPPEPPRTAYSEPSSFKMTVAAVDDSGLEWSAGRIRLIEKTTRTSCPELGSSKDWVKDQKRQVRPARRNRLKVSKSRRCVHSD